MNAPLIENQLQQIGFSDQGARVYLQLLRLSPVNAALLAKKTGIARSSVYLIVNQLAARGLAGVTYKNGVRQFVAEDPSVIQEVLQKEKAAATKKLSMASTLVDSLRLLRRSDLHIPNIVFFEGQESLKKIYLGMLREARPNSTMLIIRDEFVWNPAWQFIFQEEWNDLVRRLRTEKNIATRILINNSAEERSHAKYYRTRRALQTRLLPKKHSVHDFAIYIMDDVASILSMEKNNVMGIKITNDHIAQNFVALFESLWVQARG